MTTTDQKLILQLKRFEEANPFVIEPVSRGAVEWVVIDSRDRSPSEPMPKPVAVRLALDRNRGLRMAGGVA
ncbi:MAG: hypothetical protein HY646_02110 [Acidobacteria bacterium]|nr:hypothetical protein [Acidobacteriota bacterium]